MSAQGKETGVRAVIEVVAKALGDPGDDIRVVESQHGATTLVELFMSPGAVGRVIGRQGRTATALRTLAAIAAEKDGKNVTLEIRDGKR